MPCTLVFSVSLSGYRLNQLIYPQSFQPSIVEIYQAVVYLYASSIYEDRNEDIVKEEIMLLNQYTSTPSCKEINNNQIALSKNQMVVITCFGIM